MNLLSAFSIIACMIYVHIGIHTLKMFKKSSVSRLFFLTCQSLAVWSFAYAFVYSSPVDPGIWMKLSAWGWCSFSALALHTTLRFADIRLFHHAIPQTLIYVPAAIFLYMSQFVFGFADPPSQGVSDFFYTGNFIYNFSCLLAAIAVLSYMRFNSGQRRRRRQLTWIIAAAFLPFLLNLLTQVLLPEAGVDLLPPMGQLYSLSLIVGVYYANLRYGLFGIPLEVLYDEILTEMMDLFFLLSPEGRIMKVNTRTQELLKYKQSEMEGRLLVDLCREKELLEAILRCEEAQAASTKEVEVHCTDKAGCTIPVRLSISRMTNHNANETLGIMAIGQDITVRKRLEEQIRIHKEYERKLRESEERFRAMFDKHSAVMCLFDPESMQILSVNDAALAYYGYSPQQFRMMKITDLRAPQEQGESNWPDNPDENNGEAPFHIGLNHDGTLLQLRHRLASGEIRDVEIHSSLVPIGSKTIVYSIIHDITERKRAEDYINRLAYSDTLTGLANRKLFYERMEQALDAAGKSGDRLAVMYIDMDDLKLINDTYGHENGDRAIREIGQRIKDALGKEDVVARLGGDEFAVLLPGVHQLIEAYEAAELINNCLEQPIRLSAAEHIVEASIGISLYPDDGQDINTLLKRADRRMYRMKKEKKNGALPL